MALPPGPETDARHAREEADPNYRRRTPEDGVGPKYIYDPGNRNSPENSLGDFERGAFPSDEAYRKAYRLDDKKKFQSN